MNQRTASACTDCAISVAHPLRDMRRLPTSSPWQGFHTRLQHRLRLRLRLRHTHAE